LRIRDGIGAKDPQRTAAASLWAPEHRALTLGLVLTITFVASEALAVAPAVPVLARELGGLRLYGWVFSAFMLASLVGVVVAGQAADRRGPAPPYLLGLGLFIAGLLIAGTAQSMEVLVVGRAVQGFGAGAVPAVAYASIGRSLPEALRPRMFAVLSTAWVIPGLFAPGIAAFVIRHASWRWVFLGLAPFVVVTGLVALPALLKLGPPGGKPTPRRLVAALGVAGGAALVLAGLTEQAVVARIPLVVVGLAVGLPSLRRVLPPGALRARPGLPATVVSRGLLTFAFFGADAYVPLAVQSVRHHSPTLTGVAISVTTLSWTAGAWAQARMAPDREGRGMVAVGVALVVAGIAGLATTLFASVPAWLVVPAWTVAGLGMGLAYAPTTVLVLREAAPGEEGSASASLTLCDTLGWALGTGVGGAAVAAAEAANWPLRNGVLLALACAAAVGCLCLAVSRRLPAGPLVAANGTGSDVGDGR
jgi:MFS family permease